MAHYVYCLLLILSLPLTICGKTITVRSQSEFDNISKEIQTLINKHENNITINITAKKLYFHNYHLQLSNIKSNSTSITFKGNGVTLVAEGEYTSNPNNPESVYLLNEKKFFNTWTRFYELSDTIEIVDYKKNICRLRNTSSMKISSSDAYIQCTSWYSSFRAKITQADKIWIYFDAGENISMINRDYNYGKQFPRYRVLGMTQRKCYECKASSLIAISNCTIKSFLFSDFKILGSGTTGKLISIYNSKATSFKIQNCDFSAIGGTVVHEENSQNVWFTGNNIHDIKAQGFISMYLSTGARVTNNTFTKCGLDMTNTFAITMHSDNFLVSNNKISDFCYGGIGVGIWGKSSTKAKCSGRVTNNELFYTRSFMKSTAQNTLMDSGAIYTWTRCDDITISNNDIHDISGIKDNRGIFCDDGTKNVTVKGNKIRNISNSYDIDLRWSDLYENYVPDHNTGNIISNNDTSGEVRFEVRKTK